MNKIIALRIWLALLAAFALGALVGGKIMLEKSDSKAGELINTALGQPNDVNYNLYWDVYKRLIERYPGEIDRQKLLYGAIRGTVDALGDRFSLFLTPEETEKFFEEIQGEFSGIGAEITKEGDQFIVVAPLPNSPAAKSGLKAKDVILGIDGRDASEFELNELINAIRGSAGTEVTLTIIRESVDEQREYKVRRETISLPSLEYSQRDDGLAYVHLIQFSDDTTSEIAKAADQILAKKARGIILDLRNNPGGYLDASIDVASLFVKDGPMVIEENKQGERKDFDPTLEPKLADIPLVVLVNGGSASASEIVAGAIQDRGEGTIVGTKTFGKGSVQEVENLSDGSSLRLTVAKWLTPTSRAINGEGITPDAVVDELEDTETDEQLDRAVELLK
ncbi:S41 family peptidase [Candidatus Berkelbacteria bacterium]|nr:S41 family peptidase [Candidatus Berkelbacteria bacterium]